MIFSLSKKRIPSWLVPSFFIVMTILILVFNDVFGEKDSFIVFTLVFFATMTVVFIRWIFLQVRLILKLKKEKTETELMHLKSQVNPHFFFNTLNNLYGLVGQDTDRAQKLILKLSDMMRYSIYKGQNEVVTLGEEIEYLHNYIDLHKMRYHKEIEVNYVCEVEDRGLLIMPLLFIILLENAFKHGVENLRKDAFVSIRLEASKKSVEFEIENNFDPDEKKEAEGIGLNNLRRRLALAYSGRHELSTVVEGNVFKSKLSLKV